VALGTAVLIGEFNAPKEWSNGHNKKKGTEDICC